MKKARNLFLALACLTLLSSCGETSSVEESSQTSSTSTSTNIKVTVSGESTIMVGKTTQLTVRVSRDSEDGGFTASVSDSSVLSYEVDGDYINVTGLKIGTATVTATSVTDPTVSGSLEISVVAVTNPVLTITADNTLIDQNGTINLSVTVEDYDGDVSYTWKSLYNKGTISSSDSTAVYTGTKYGSDTIQVSFAVGSETYSDTVDVYIEADHTGWTALSTADEVIAAFFVSGTISGNYYLTNDIDLNGYQIPYLASSFAGVLDGQGYAISNFEVLGNAENSYASGGFFDSIASGGFIFSTGFENAVIGQEGSGWGTSVVCCECLGDLENISVSVNHTYNNAELVDSNNWFPFNSALVGVFKEGTSYRNIVIDIDETTDGYGTIFADTAYPAGGSAGTTAQSEQTFSVVNFYTNSDVIGGSVWEWGSPVEDLSSYHTDLTWTSSSADEYEDLDSNIWSISAGAKPTLIGLAD